MVFDTLCFSKYLTRQKSLLLFYRCLSKRQEYMKCYEILGLPENSDQEQIRTAYLKLVKRFHPDSGTDEADVNKFHEIDRAFKILTNKKSQERWGVEEHIRDNDEECDITHTVSQHRHYLSFDGVGSGTPFQREKQYIKFKAMQAADNVLKHRIAKVTADDKSLMTKVSLKHKIKTKYGFDRLVEDLIQESMSRGEFNNLSGCGKPLPDHHAKNPYVDFVTHKLNEVLIENGFTPEWITLQKEIRDEVKMLKDDLLRERSLFGPYPLTTDDNLIWTDIICKYENLVTQINKKINKYNLVVPVLNKQMLQIDLRKEAQKVIINGPFSSSTDESLRKSSQVDHRNKGGNIFGFLEILFKNDK